MTRLKSAEEIEKQWDRILEDSKEMVEYSSNPEKWAEDIEGNEMACSDYGGCPFKGKQCSMTQSSLGSLMDHGKKFAHVKKTEGAGDNLMSLMDIINKAKTKTKTVDTEPASKSPLEVAAAKALAARGNTEGATGVNPPPVDAEAPAELAAATEKQVPQTWLNRLEKGHKPRNAEETAWRAEQADAAPPPSEPLAVDSPTGKKVQEAMEIAEKGEAAEKVELNGGMFTLAIDCFPVKGSEKLQGALTLPEVLRPLKTAVQEMKKVPYWNLIPYAEGEKLLAACTEKQFAEEGNPIGLVIADSGSPEWKACADVLVAAADVVIRG